MISSTDGRGQQKQLNNKWGKSFERAALSMILALSHYDTRDRLSPLIHHLPDFQFQLEII